MNQNRSDEQTLYQLDVIREIQAIFHTIGGCFWLRGGWAIDFMLGRITRPHEDIDIVTWVQHRELLETALVEAGFVRIPVSGRQTDFRKGDVDIQLVYLTRSSEGGLILNGLPEWIWRADSLPLKLFTQQGISVYVLNPKQLLEEKETYVQIGRALRPKDIESMKQLNDICKQISWDIEALHYAN